MSYPASKLAVRDSFDDEDVSDDVEDEVFIRDGRNGFKVDEERGVKRPLMAPRRKSKSSQLHNAIGRSPPCRAFCAPCCYGCIALAAMLGLIMLVVTLIMFPLPLDQVMKFLKAGETSQFGGIVVPCTELVVEGVWTKSLSKLTVESAVRLNDVNRDGIMDVIVGYGTGADGHNVPDFVCTLYFDRKTPCLGGVIALDGLTGNTIWQHWTSHPVFMVDCSADLTDDKTNDCLISGKGGVLQLVNGHDGSNVWQYVEEAAEAERHGEPLVDIFSAQFLQDVDGDGLPDVLAAHTQDLPAGLTAGHLVLISGKEGKVLQKVATPHREETYYAPQVLVHLDGVSLVVFGTGGQASPGGLYVVPLHNLVKGNMLQVKELYRDEAKGVMSPPVLADLNEDGSEDIVAAMFNSMVIAFSGLTFQPLWNFSFPSSETSSAPTPSYFNDDDIPDFLVKYQNGPGFPVYYSSQTTVLDGKTGAPLLDKPVVDTTGSQMGGLSISVEGWGNDIVLYWTANCLHHEGPTKPFSFMPGSSVQAQSRVDLCQMLFNSTLSTQFVALSQHIEPPGIAVYSSEEHRELEYNCSINTSTYAHQYLQTHPDFLDAYGLNTIYSKMMTNDKKKGFQGDTMGASSFRHRGDDTVLVNSIKAKSPNYLYSEGDYVLSNQAQNRISNDAGAQEEMLTANLQGNSQYPNLRKHGGTQPLEQTWEQQEDDGNIPLTYSNLMDGNPGSNRDSDYEVLYGPVNQESLGGSQQGFPVNAEQDKRTGYDRIKRDTEHVHGLQRLTSLGTLAPPVWASNKNDTTDLVFVTYWIHPMTEAHLVLGKEKECLEKKLAQTANANGKYNFEPEMIAKDCLDYKGEEKPAESDYDQLSLNMGQATVYRLRIGCRCRSVGNGERCSAILPFDQQGWPAFMGHNGDGHFRPRYS